MLRCPWLDFFRTLLILHLPQEYARRRHKNSLAEAVGAGASLTTGEGGVVEPAASGTSGSGPRNCRAEGAAAVVVSWKYSATTVLSQLKTENVDPV